LAATWVMVVNALKQGTKKQKDVLEKSDIKTLYKSKLGL
jgi:hypothetical protein